MSAVAAHNTDCWPVDAAFDAYRTAGVPKGGHKGIYTSKTIAMYCILDGHDSK